MRTVLKTAAVLVVVFAMLLLTGLFEKKAAAAGDLDEILLYDITVDVNEDATLTMKYHIDWKVLDSDSDGPLSWVTVGIPNSHYISYKALTDTIKDISYSSSKGSSLKITFDKNYYKDEVVSFEFELIQDYMYDMNLLTEGETVFDFTPGWFDELNVDKLVLRWRDDKALSWSPSCKTVDHYLTWETSLGHGDTYSVSITYPNDAFLFDVSKSASKEKEDSDAFANAVIAIIAIVFLFAPVLIVILCFVAIAIGYKRRSGLGSTEKKITRTKVEYYPDCPGCGAPRPEGKDNCEFCGRSFIKSEVKIEEKDIPEEEKEIKEKKENGLYRYHSSPNTYVRVHVVNVPARRSYSSSSRSYSSSSRSHSSCAHSSCACACACACAGGGRAGCTTKDFYNTNLKLKQLEIKKKARRA